MLHFCTKFSGRYLFWLGDYSYDHSEATCYGVRQRRRATGSVSDTQRMALRLL